MEIKKPAVAGTLESSDAMVTVEPNEGCGIEFELDSVVMHQYGDSIRHTVMETLERLLQHDQLCTLPGIPSGHRLSFLTHPA